MMVQRAQEVSTRIEHQCNDQRQDRQCNADRVSSGSSSGDSDWPLTVPPGHLILRRDPEPQPDSESEDNPDASIPPIVRSPPVFGPEPPPGLIEELQMEEFLAAARRRRAAPADGQ